MNNFKDFGIKLEIKNFVGDKISVKKLLNSQIRVFDFKIEPSKKKEGTELLTLQIEKSDEKRIVFSGSKGLMSQIQQVPKEKFPFTTVIIGDNDYYQFT